MTYHGSYESKEQCESSGGEWVKQYRKKDGSLVHGFCRENKSSDVMNLKYHKKELGDKTELEAKYNNYKVHVFEDDVEPDRYTWAITKNGDEDNLWYDDATYPNTEVAKKEAKKILSGIVNKKR